MGTTKYQYLVKVNRLDWSTELNDWLNTIVGTDNVKYVKSYDNYTYLRYGFTNEEDALAFRLRFGTK